MKKHPLDEIAWALQNAETEKLKEYENSPEALVGRTLHVIPAPGERALFEIVTRVSPKRVFTSVTSYWIDSGFEVRGGNAHAKVIKKGGSND